MCLNSLQMEEEALNGLMVFPSFRCLSTKLLKMAHVGLRSKELEVLLTQKKLPGPQLKQEEPFLMSFISCVILGWTLMATLLISISLKVRKCPIFNLMMIYQKLYLFFLPNNFTTLLNFSF